MKTILKKSLALAVCVALCLTAFIGSLSVSASGTATAVISTATVPNGTTSTSLTVTISGSPNIAGARFDIVADATKATLGTPTVTSGASVEVSTPETGTTRFVVVADNVSTGLASIVVTLPYTNVTTTAGTYDVEFGELLEVAEVGETLMTVTPTDGSITVQAAHVHDFSGAWQSNANYHWKVCEADDTIGNQAAHTFGDWTTTVDPGCTTTGTKTRTCSVCGYVESDTVAATGHTPAEAVQENVVPATCNTAGSYDSVVYCSVCDAEISRTTGVVIPATGDHTAAEAVQENVVAATCGAAGSYDSVVYCSECGTEISRTTGNVIPATGEHTWGAYTSNADGHSRTCSVCSAVDAGEHDGDPCSVCGYTAPVVACTHVVGTVVDSTPATQESTGSLTYICSECNEEVTVDVAYTRFARANDVGLAAESETQLYFGVRLTDLVRVMSDGANSSGTWDNIIMRYDTTDKFGDVVRYDDLSKAETTIIGSREVRKFSYGVASIYMGNNVTGTVFVYCAANDTWYSGTQMTKSVKECAITMMSGAPTLFTDLLNYGAAAQINFNYNTSNLANEGINQSNATPGTASVLDQKVIASSSTAEYPATFASFGAEAESKVLMNVEFQFGKSYYADYVEQYNGLKVVVSYTNFAGDPVSQTFYNVAGYPNAEHTFAQIEGNNRRFGFQFSGLTAADLRQPVTFNLYTADDTKLTTDHVYSIQSFVYAQRTSGSASENLLNVLDAMMKFSDSAKAFLLAA